MPTRVWSSAWVFSTYRSNQLQTCANSPFRVVFMRLGIAEVNNRPMARVRSHETAEALHNLCDAFVIGRDDFAEVFRIHPR